jgi:phenylalanyl-tRNA synthetase alpha chain
MTDIAALQSDILAQIAAAQDEAALEAVRVATLGKKGSVSALLATMGKLDPEERKVQGPRFNGLRDTVTAAIAARKAELADAALDTRLAA